MLHTETHPTVHYRPSSAQEQAFDALAAIYDEIEIFHAPTTLAPERFEARAYDRQGRVRAIRHLDGAGNEA